MSKKRFNRRLVNGILLLDKPLGISSNAALQAVKALFFAAKAGHTGSLDPLATGLLPICFGEATKFSQYFLDADKAYEVTAQLGVRTTTSDSEGEVVSTRDVPVLTLEEIEAACDAFRGEIQQTPSIYSALKYQGKPLYEYARQGIDVPRPTRPITIYDLKILKWESPNLTLSVSCSKGTYIRTLVDDLGEALGCGAHVTALRRTSVGGLGQDWVTIEKLEALKAEKAFAEMDAWLLSLDDVMHCWPAMVVTAEQKLKLQQGQSFMADATASTVAVYTDAQQFIGMASCEAGIVKPIRLISQ